MPQTKDDNRHARLRKWLLPLKIVFWAALAVVLFITGIVVGSVQIFTPGRLSAYAQTVANRALNADVSIGSVELSARRSLPFIDIDIDSVVIVSRDIKALPGEARDTIPAWGDTLACVRHLHGGFNVFKLVRHIIELHDLQIIEPQVNVLVVNENINNFSIIKESAPDSDTTALAVPDIRLNRFRLVSPRVIRFADMPQGIRAAAIITSAEIVNQPSGSDAPDAYMPLYNVKFDCDVSSPLLRYFGEREVAFGLNGVLEWRHTNPYELRLSDFKWRVSKVTGTVDTALDFNDRLTLESLTCGIDPVSVADILALVPAEQARRYSIPTDISTDANISLEAGLTAPYIVGNLDVPHMQVSVNVPPCYVKWQRLDIERLMLELGITLNGGTIDNSVIEIKHLSAAGPGTDIEVKGRLTDIGDDPLFDGRVDGHIHLEHLPAWITTHMHGSLKGLVSAGTDMRLRPSMFDRDNFHRLQLHGDIALDNLYYLADDTLSLYTVHHAQARFGSNQDFTRSDGATIDSLLTGRVLVDSSYILVSGLDLHLRDIELGIAAINKNTAADTSAIIPMGGRLKVGRFSLVSMGDSAGMRLSGLDGRLSMQRSHSDRRLPLFSLDASIDKISTGDNHTRFLVGKSRLRIKANRLADAQLPVSRRQIRHLTDSLRRVHPDIPVDSVYNLAAEIRHRHRHGHRVHTAVDNNNEIIYWGTSSALARLLLDWDLQGSLSASRAGLYTTAFPLPNRVDHLQIDFCNDSISLDNIACTVGRSDFILSGRISNLKRAFTSRLYRQPLKINFDLVSQFIDINQVADAIFSGATHHRAKITAGKDGDGIYREIQSQCLDNDTRAPVLIPTNIDARLNVKAASVMYSDIRLSDFSGSLLMYDGALNLHELTATSDAGSVNISALYSAPNKDNMQFGLGLSLDDFNISRFLELVPAVDSIMPLMRDLSGIINARIAATTHINEHMDFVLPSLKAAINITGDSLTIVDQSTFKSIAKWLMFKDKNENIIKHISVEMLVEDNTLQVYPFTFDFDRYRLGIQGHNDLDLNFDYHVAVLHSPIPFKFGINIMGRPHKFKIRLGGAHFNERASTSRALVVETTRVNLVKQFEDIFRRGVSHADFANINIIQRPSPQDFDLDTDTLSAADSLYLRNEGLLPPQ